MDILLFKEFKGSSEIYQVKLQRPSPQSVMALNLINSVCHILNVIHQDYHDTIEIVKLPALKYPIAPPITINIATINPTKS